MTPVRFLWAVLGLAALFFAVVAAANFAIDPYLMFQRPRVAGLNAVKPAVETREAMMKHHQAARQAPRTVVLGSSRSDIGFDPASKAWPSEMRPIYNLSTVGADLQTNMQFLNRMLAQSGSKPSQLVVGLDFESFLYPEGSAPPIPASSSGEPTVLALAQEYVAGLLTLDALQDSVLTLWANQRGSVTMDLEDSGRLAEGHLRRWTAADGVALLFEQKNRLTVQRYGARRHVLGDATVPLYDEVQLQALARLARSRSMRLALVLQPAHVTRLELLAALGYWSDYEAWKRRLTTFAASARDHGIDVQVWDFGGYEAFTTEDVPAPGDRNARLRWFWDPVHYTTAFGDEMISVLGGTAPALASATLLTPATIDGRLAQVRADRQAWREQHGEAVKALEQLACERRPTCKVGEVSARPL